MTFVYMRNRITRAHNCTLTVLGDHRQGSSQKRTQDGQQQRNSHRPLPSVRAVKEEAPPMFLARHGCVNDDDEGLSFSLSGSLRRASRETYTSFFNKKRLERARAHDDDDDQGRKRTERDGQRRGWQRENRTEGRRQG